MRQWALAWRLAPKIQNTFKCIFKKLPTSPADFKVIRLHGQGLHMHVLHSTSAAGVHQDLLTWQGSFLRIRISGYFSTSQACKFHRKYCPCATDQPVKEASHAHGIDIQPKWSICPDQLRDFGSLLPRDQLRGDSKFSAGIGLCSFDLPEAG